MELGELLGWSTCGDAGQVVGEGAHVNSACSPGTLTSPLLQLALPEFYLLITHK